MPTAAGAAGAVQDAGSDGGGLDASDEEPGDSQLSLLQNAPRATQLRAPRGLAPGSRAGAVARRAAEGARDSGHARQRMGQLARAVLVTPAVMGTRSLRLYVLVQKHRLQHPGLVELGDRARPGPGDDSRAVFAGSATGLPSAVLGCLQAAVGPSSTAADCQVPNDAWVRPADLGEEVGAWEALLARANFKGEKHQERDLRVFFRRCLRLAKVCSPASVAAEAACRWGVSVLAVVERDPFPVGPTGSLVLFANGIGDALPGDGVPVDVLYEARNSWLSRELLLVPSVNCCSQLPNVCACWGIGDCDAWQREQLDTGLQQRGKASINAALASSCGRRGLEQRIHDGGFSSPSQPSQEQSSQDAHETSADGSDSNLFSDMSDVHNSSLRSEFGLELSEDMDNSALTSTGAQGEHSAAGVEGEHSAAGVGTSVGCGDSDMMLSANDTVPSGSSPRTDGAACGMDEY